MPEGVEHSVPLGSTPRESTQVFIPLMPEGVEHAFLVFGEPGVLKVFIPLMPEGVEHSVSELVRVILEACLSL